MKKQGRKQFLNEDNVSSRCSFLNGCSDDWTVLLFLKIIFDAFDKLTTMFFYRFVFFLDGSGSSVKFKNSSTQYVTSHDLVRFARRNFMKGSLSAMKTTTMLNVKVSVFRKRSEVVALFMPLLWDLSRRNGSWEEV